MIPYGLKPVPFIDSVFPQPFMAGFDGCAEEYRGTTRTYRKSGGMEHQQICGTSAVVKPF
jgi:hypothetical protein